MAHQNIRIPPDSNGKRIYHRVELIINYDNGTQEFSVGNSVVFASSGVYGNIIEVNGSVSNGEIHILLDHDSTTVVIDGENIQVSGVTYATANGTGTLYYIPNMQIVGGNSTNYNVFADQYGSLYTRFPEGHPQLDAFGRLQVSQASTLGDYIHTYDKLSDIISETTSGSASGSYNGNVPCITMSTGSVSGDKIIRITDMHHLYQPGTSHLVETSIWNGDSGKTGNRRRWGYFNEENGIFFELNGTTLYVVIRSNATGNVIETKIAQENWNSDTLDGDNDAENLSGYTLDITKSNIFWMDFQWLGVGRIRFGININGTRIIVHEHYHANSYSRTSMGSGSLPLRWENENTSNTSGTSELNVICSTVKTEGEFDPDSKIFSDHSDSKTVNTSASWLPLLSSRMKQTFKGKDNRKIGIPQTTSIYNLGSETIEVSLILNGSLTGATWNVDPNVNSAMEEDKDATGITGGNEVHSVFVPSGSERKIYWEFSLETLQGKLFRKANITDIPNHLTIAAKLFENQSGSTTAKATMNWKEIG